MRNLITYEDFLILESQKMYNDFLKIDGKRKFIESLSTSKFLSEDVRFFAEFLLEDESWDLIFEDSLNEEGESIADRFKAKAVAALQVAKEKGKKYLSDTQEMILKIGGNIKGVIDKILEAVKAFLAKSWEFIKSQVESNYDKIKEKVTEAAKGKFKGQADIAKKEVKNLGAMADGTLKWCTGGFTEQMSKTLDKASEVSESYILALENAYYLASSELINENEDFANYLMEEINEGDHGHEGPKIPFLSALAHKVAGLEPFKSLHKVEHAAGDAANKGLSGISSILTKVANAPGPFEFVLVGGIFALITGYAIKAGVKSILLEIGAGALGAMVVSTLPGIGTVLMGMKYAAKAIWCVGVCETAISLVSKGEEHKEDKKEEE